MLLPPPMFLFGIFFVSLLLGSALLHTGVQAWRAPSSKPWLARAFAAFFAACGGLLLVVSAASFVLWW